MDRCSLHAMSRSCLFWTSLILFTLFDMMVSILYVSVDVFCKGL